MAAVAMCSGSPVRFTGSPFCIQSEGLALSHALQNFAKTTPGATTLTRRGESSSASDRLASTTFARGLTPFEKRFRSTGLYQKKSAVLYDNVALGREGPLDRESWLATEQAVLILTGALSSSVVALLAKAGRGPLGLPRFATTPFVLRSRACLVNTPAVAAQFFAQEYHL